MVKKLWRYVKPFSYNISVSRTDRRTDRIAMSISRVSLLTRDKNEDSELHVYKIVLVGQVMFQIRQN